MSIIKDGLKLLGDVTGIGSVKDAINVVVNAIKGDPELEQKLRDFELEKMKLKLAENASVRDLLKAEVTSEDKFVRRVRPAVIWCVVAVIAANFIILPILNASFSAIGIHTVTLQYPDLPENVYWLFGSLFGLYTGARSWDKMNKTKNGNRK
jgi:hypothetical protein